MNKQISRAIACTGMSTVLISLGQVAPVQANEASTAAIVGGAAAIVGALIYDSNNRPYYIRDNHRYYVSNQAANSYRQRHRGNERRAYVPEREYPVGRNERDEHGDHGDHNRR